MEIKGYALITTTADCEFAMGPESDWQGKIVRVVEFNDDSESVLAVNRAANGMGTFDYKDVKSKFLCEEEAGVLLPPGLPKSHKMLAAMKRLHRKGGYNDILKQMVVINSMRVNEFNDDFLFQKQ